MAEAQQQLSQKQQYQRLMQAKAQAKRAGQATPKLDAKIEKLKTLMGSTIQKKAPNKPSPGKCTVYKGVNPFPVQGGACTPK